MHERIAEELRDCLGSCTPNRGRRLRAIFGAMEVSLRPHNEHLRSEMDGELRQLVETLVEARRNCDEFRCLPADLQELADVHCFLGLAAVFMKGLTDDLPPGPKAGAEQRFAEEVGAYAGGRVCSIIDKWRSTWIERHGSEPPVSTYDRVREAIRAGLAADRAIGGGYLFGEMLMAIDGHLLKLRDEQARDPKHNQRILVDIARGRITVDGTEYPAKAHWCSVVQALINEGGHYLTGDQLHDLHGCAGKKWSREFANLKEAIPPLADRILSDGRNGYRIVDF